MDKTMMNICFLFDHLSAKSDTLTWEECIGKEFAGHLSIDVHLDTVCQGIARYEKSSTIYLLDKSKIYDLYIYTNGRIERYNGHGKPHLRFDLLFVSPYAIHALDHVLSCYITIKTVLSFPAIWWHEYPDLYPYSLLEKNIADLQRINTCFLVPNERMRDYLIRMAMLYSGLDISERIMTLPYFVADFYERQPSPDFISIVDSGGQWRWTANHIWAKAFVEYCNNNPSTRLHFTFSIKDEANHDHTEYQQQIVETYSKLKDPHKVRIIKWAEKDLLKKHLMKAHYGLSINMDTIEGYLSSRARLQDYIAHKLPVISTCENSFYKDNKNICVAVEPTHDSFMKLFARLENSEALPQASDYDSKSHTASYKQKINALLLALEDAPAASPPAKKTDIKVGHNSLNRVYAARSAVAAFRKLTYQLPKESLLFYIREITKDPNITPLLKCDRDLVLQFLNLATDTLTREFETDYAPQLEKILDENALIERHKNQKKNEHGA